MARDIVLLECLTHSVDVKRSDTKAMVSLDLADESAVAALSRDVVIGLYSYGRYSYGLYSYGLDSYGLYSCGLYSCGLHSYGRHSHGLCSYGLCSHGLCSYGLWLSDTKAMLDLGDESAVAALSYDVALLMNHDYIGHNYIGHKHTSHNYVGHTYIGRACIGSARRHNRPACAAAGC